MKKLLLLSLTLFLGVVVNAQIEFKPGVKAGLNVTNFTNIDDGPTEGKSISSFHVGGVFGIKFVDFYTLQPELLYTRQGSEIQGQLVIDDQVFNETFKVEVNYISLHITNKFFVGGSGFNFQVAPVIDILVDSKNIDSPEGFDFAIAGGIGYNSPFGLTIDLRYKQGLVDVFGRNVNTGDPIDNVEVGDLVLNKGFQLSFGYLFDL